MKDKTRFETKGIKFMAIRVNKNAYTAFVHEDQLIVREGHEFHQEQIEIKLPSTSWKFFCFTDSATDDQAMSLVSLIDEDNPLYGYEHYMSDSRFESVDRCDPFHTAKLSLNSLLRTHDINPNDKWALLIYI